MYKVMKVFRDKYTKQLYSIGDNFASNDSERIKDLLTRELIAGVPLDTPANIDYESLTKNELVKLLVHRNIDFNKRQSKPELIKLLQGGGLDAD